MLSIAGLGVEVSSRDERIARLVASSFGRFGADQRVDATIEIGVVAEPGLWQDDSAEPRVDEVRGELLIEHRDFVARLDPERLSMLALQPRRTLSIENALRVLVALALVRRDGLLLHAAGALRGGDATVLFGRSGSGKSTVARLARGLAVLGDDLVALRRADEGWQAHATPFGGSLGRRRRPRSGRLRSLMRLRQASALDERRLPIARAVGELLQSTVLPAALERDRAMALERCVAVARDVDVRELHFPVDNRLWRWLGERGL